jgi:hypothetical protein
MPPAARGALPSSASMPLLFLSPTKANRIGERNILRRRD